MVSFFSGSLTILFLRPSGRGINIMSCYVCWSSVTTPRLDPTPLLDIYELLSLPQHLGFSKFLSFCLMPVFPIEFKFP